MLLRGDDSRLIEHVAVRGAGLLVDGHVEVDVEVAMSGVLRQLVVVGLLRHLGEVDHSIWRRHVLHSEIVLVRVVDT